MTWKMMVIAGASLALLAPVGAKAAGPVPDKTGAFVAFCPDHIADCRAKVQEIDIAAMAGKMWGAKWTHSCGKGYGVTNDAATREVLAWLSLHRETYDLPTSDGLMAAFDHLWPCRL